MITTLSATTTDEIQAQLIGAESAVGGSRVLTLVISTDASGLEEALQAAHGASRDHPCRVIAVVMPSVSQPDLAQPDRLDAEIRLGHDTGAGETLVLRPSGLAAAHPDTLVVPFLLPDVPVVTWWPTQLPSVPSRDPLGRLAGTRITNSPAQDDPAGALVALAPGYSRGDIDLAWTRATLWRAIVAATLDPALRRGLVGPIEVAGECGNASMALLIPWLRLHTNTEVTKVAIEGYSGIAHVVMRTKEGVYRIERTDEERVRVFTPASPLGQLVTMPRREPVTTLNEELRRLAPDVVFEETLAAFAAEHGCRCAAGLTTAAKQG